MRVLILLMLVASSAYIVLAAEPLSPLEEAYGVNEVTIRNEAEIRWVKDNKYIIYDFFEKRNHYVRFVTDRELVEILRNEKSRERMGVDEANLTPYLEEVREERGIAYEESKSAPYTEPKTYFPDVNEQKELLIDERDRPDVNKGAKKIECVRRHSYSIFDPFRKANKWVTWTSDEWLLRIMETESSVVPKQCRLS